MSTHEFLKWAGSSFKIASTTRKALALLAAVLLVTGLCLEPLASAGLGVESNEPNSLAAAAAVKSGELARGKIDDNFLANFRPCEQRNARFDFARATVFSATNTFFLAEASQLAHCGDDADFERTTRLLGFKNAKRFSHFTMGVQAYLATNDTFALVSFRGTQVPANYIQNARFLPVDGASYQLKGRLHMGFAASQNAVWPQLAHALNAPGVRGKPLIITGHSLGGALALITALRAAGAGHDVRLLFTFGQPRVGDAVFAKSIEETLGNRYIRVVYDNDVVPRMPLSAMSAVRVRPMLPSWLAQWVEDTAKDANYRHTGRFYFIDSLGVVVAKGAGQEEARGAALLAEAFDEADAAYWEGGARPGGKPAVNSSVWGLIQTSLSPIMNHMPRKYVSVISGLED